MTFPAQLGMHMAAALIVVGALWLVYAVLRMLLKTRPQGGGKSAGYAHGPGSGRAAEASGSGSPTAADNGSGGRPAAPSGTTPTVARAALTPDCPSLDSEFWRCNPTEPLAPSELVRWKNITDAYEWTAGVVVLDGGRRFNYGGPVHGPRPVVPGGESCHD